MGTIVRDITIPHDPGGRHAAIIKDGAYLRHVIHMADNVLRIIDSEGNVLYTEEALRGTNIAVVTIDASVSSFGTPHVVLEVAGYDPGTDDSRVIIVATSFPVAPPIYNY